jgi:MFS family permease
VGLNCDFPSLTSSCALLLNAPIVLKWVSIIFLVGASIQVAGTVNISWIYGKLFECLIRLNLNLSHPGGRFVAGLGVGAMTAIAPSYVAESAPAAVRGRITGFFQVVTVLGVCVLPFLMTELNAKSVFIPRAPFV